MAEIRQADLTGDLPAIRSLWLEYLTWGINEMEARYGFRMPIQETLERNLADIARFQPPDGCILLAFVENETIGTACMHRIGATTAEIKRMYVRPSGRGGGLGRLMLDRLIEAARAAGYRSIRLDSPHFMTAAHALYRSSGFVEIEYYPESEVPEAHKDFRVFMEKLL